MAEAKIKVMLVDDHSLIRDGLRALIDAEADMRVICEADSALVALEIFRRQKPDIVIMDISLPDYSGLQIIPQILDISKEFGLKSRVIILSMYSKESLINQALQFGVMGYISKCGQSREIIYAIRSVYKGEYYLCQKLVHAIVPKYIKQNNQYSEEAYNLLTQREQEIFRLLVEGNSNHDIAILLSISDKTVQRHRSNLMAKLEVHSYRELLQYGIRIGIFDPKSDGDMI